MVARRIGDGRRVILAHYFGFEPPARAVTATSGLTGAYLEELARRIRARGTERLDEDIAALLAQAPIARAGRIRAPMLDPTTSAEA